MSTTAERVEDMIRELKIDQVRFAAMAGASKSVVNQWINGKIKTIGPKYAYSIQERSGYRAEWVMLGELPKNCDSNSTAEYTIPASAQDTLSPEALAIARAYEAANTDLKIALRALARIALGNDCDAGPTSTFYRSPDTIDDVLPGTPSAFNPNVSIRGHVTHEPKAQDYYKRKTDR